MKQHKMSSKITLLAFAGYTLFSTSCSTIKSMSNTTKGSVIGAAGGGTLGAIIGKKAGNTAVGAIIGGAIGGTAGAFIGRNMDRQAEELKKNLPDAEVIREGEGIIVKFDSGILFDFNSATLKAKAKENVQKLVSSLNSNPQTNVLIVGHTDNLGSDAYNLSLSEKRASSVRDYATSLGISTSRLKVSGKGETEPIADNAIESGRASNRRVEVVILANDAMKADAKTK
ncbi:OmpA family protein [Desertivirga xinjiangensis]|uniref:OmpA family protein n=1 Tax=Desertivirga xinjiangensis TaxID=539206 RepID=UPI00210E0F04|nr:OmpA family protein [Pedobacter xinjiangensis]